MIYFVFFMIIICIGSMIGFYGVPRFIARVYLARGPADFRYKEYGFYLETGVIYNFKTHNIERFVVENGRLCYDMERASRYEALFLKDGQEFDKAFQEAYQAYVNRKFEEDILGGEKRR